MISPMRDRQEKRAIVVVTVLNAVGLVTQLYIHYHLVDWVRDKTEHSVAAKISVYEGIPLMCFFLTLGSIWSCWVRNFGKAKSPSSLPGTPPLSPPPPAGGQPMA